MTDHKYIGINEQNTNSTDDFESTCTYANSKCGSGIQYRKILCMQQIVNEQGTNMYSVNHIYC